MFSSNSAPRRNHRVSYFKLKLIYENDEEEEDLSMPTLIEDFSCS
ncbi:unnamed protein product [Camellia sinensis]